MIATERLTLLGWRDDDAAAHHAMCADPAVMAYLGPAPSPIDSAAWVMRQNAILADYGACFWALERRDTGAFIGWCGIKPGPVGTPIDAEPEIGWSLVREHWGQGYAREAADAALAWGWRVLNLPTVWAITVPANTASRTLMERLGMNRVVDGNFDHPKLAEDDAHRRHILYRIDRPAYV
ncbi:RimJ/RimL family protein N-acetyltransferase [Sphingomonas sp. PP-F2F-A104-K0414]|uniref:GNAT family N-acetyltransferase n=1 Tax=Sphingomonas sp. PP-F2F-A104-K0414 TaxID=2135661 RepID=UPI00104FD0B0|nr:GNAT family N-acetyltransferase [Sphingomonas sp. PP-F2F-A104-K0414]TCP98542.1 RimJ/RimL family protein N-acetyltransferase [Sphingomonas sp. PP-F2F-A104-K0414]